MESKRWRFSIAALLVATAFSAVLFAWWRDRTQSLRELDALRIQHEHNVRRMQSQMQERNLLNTLRVDAATKTIHELEAKELQVERI